MKLTNATVTALGLPAGKLDAIFFDDDLPGFGVRLRAGGRRTWICQYRVGAKQRRIKLGIVGVLDADKARSAAKHRLAQVTLGGDPQADKLLTRAKASITLIAVIESYLGAKKASLRPKSFEETGRYLRKHWRPLHGLPVHKIERRNIAARLAEITDENGPVAATRARAALSALLAWTVGQGLADANAVIGTNRPAEPISRDRVLTDAEIHEIWAACRDDDYSRIIKLLLLTGQRRDEVGAIGWSEIDTDRHIWCIPGSRTKNKRQQVVPLSPLALTVIANARRRVGNDRLFGKGAEGFAGWSKAKAALDRRISEARIAAAAGQGTPPGTTSIADWRLHDLRRTVATMMADKLGVLPHVVEVVLNHVSGHKSGVAGVYNRAGYEREVRAALLVWADHLESIVEASERKIVPLRTQVGA
jgi:integrase